VGLVCGWGGGGGGGGWGGGGWGGGGGGGGGGGESNMEKLLLLDWKRKTGGGSAQPLEKTESTGKEKPFARREKMQIRGQKKHGTNELQMPQKKGKMSRFSWSDGKETEASYGGERKRGSWSNAGGERGYINEPSPHPPQKEEGKKNNLIRRKEKEGGKRGGGKGKCWGGGHKTSLFYLCVLSFAPQGGKKKHALLPGEK